MADVITRLKVESTEYDSKIKRAAQGLLQMEQACRKVGGTLAILEKDELEFVKGLGKMETVSKDARGQLNELTKAFTDLSLQYKRLTDEEKQGDFGKALASSLGELKTRIQDTKKDLADIGQELSGSKFGQFGGIIDGIGHKMGVSANLTELLTSKTALMTAGIGAAVAAIYKGTEAWTKYNAELSKQDQQTQVITGLKGYEADHMTDVMRALSDTYKVDFRQAVEAANTLMSQFGVSGSEAIQLIKDGMQGMIQGDGPKMLSMIQQYAPAFRDAGVSASQLVAVIQNSEGGIFTDQNMNAIVMGIKNIRLMTKQTSDALEKLGIDGQEMSRKLNEGSITVFDALKQVASQLKTVDSNSQAAGEVMQAVFGRQGVTAGTNIAKAIETLNTNLEETKKQTGELGDAFADLQTANEKLNTAIRDCFEYDGWEQMVTGIKANLVTALSVVIEKLADIKNMLFGISPEKTKQDFISGENGQVNVDKKIEQLKGSNYKEVRVGADLREFDKEISKREAELQKLHKAAQQPGQTNFLPEINRLKAERDALKEMREDYARRASEVIYGSNKKEELPEPPKPDPIAKSTAKSTAKELNPMQQAQKEISALTEEALTADEDRLEVIKKEIAALNEQLKVYKGIQDFVQGKEPNWNIQVGDRKAFEAEQKRRFDVELGISKNAFTEKNVSSFISDLKNQIQTAGLGSELYNNLTAQLADANALANLMQTAIKNGIDISQFNPQDLWKKVFGENPGDYISEETWKSIVEKLNEYAKDNPIKMNFATGEVSSAKTATQKSTDSLLSEISSRISSVSGGLSSVSSGLENLGVTLPDGLSDVVSVMSGLSSVIQGVQSIISGLGSTSLGANTAAVSAGSTTIATSTATLATALGANTTAIYASMAAQAAETTTDTLSSVIGTGVLLALSTGGVVPHAANGYFVPGTHYSGDVTPIMANAGELVLNTSSQQSLASEILNAQSLIGSIYGLYNLEHSVFGSSRQANLAGQIGGNTQRGGGGQTYVSGEQIFLAVNNYLRRSGYGEIVTSRR